MSTVLREVEVADEFPVWGPLTDAGAQLSGTRASAGGSYVLAARDARVLTDARTGGGAAIYAGELLLGALTSCALGAIEAAAEDRGITLRDIRIEARSERSESAPPRYG